ncbi:RsmD family RNA methyltransferase [Candidatus Saccharibacteria bacterium]|nr:RsmD family RNA methyltransferase [Candidatus Saccharibacteria bacterium]
MAKEKYRQTVRITGGEFRGQRIATPGEGTHPMGERERIALFNMIKDRVEGNYVLDLFCGGGTLGIEALSRGARFAMLLDNSITAVETANKNLRKLGIDGVSGLFDYDPLIGGTGQAMRVDVPLAAKTATDRYGLVLADPPYDKYNEKLIKDIPRLVLDGGMLVLSHPGEPPELKLVRLVKSKKYAGATISIYIKD